MPEDFWFQSLIWNFSVDDWATAGHFVDTIPLSKAKYGHHRSLRSDGRQSDTKDASEPATIPASLFGSQFNQFGMIM
jgi:hypothetical protein